jgi:hypothetical protein
VLILGVWVSPIGLEPAGRTADMRIHGTICKSVHLLFQAEKPRLTPLPADWFQEHLKRILNIGGVVHDDGLFLSNSRQSQSPPDGCT